MRRNLFFFGFCLATCLASVLFIGCAKDELAAPADNVALDERGLTIGAPSNVALIGLTPNNELVNLMSGPPATDLGLVPIVGLRDGEMITGIDVRAKTKELFGVSSLQILYRINSTTGEATAVSGVEFNPKIEGDLMGIDFNPSDDLLRVITNTGQFLKISPVTGAVVGVEAVLGGGSYQINGAAYLPAQGLTKPSLYEIDLASNALYRQNANGSLQYLGATGFFWTGDGGFEITPAAVGYTVQYGNSRGFNGSFGVDDTSQPAYRLYKIDLRTGRASSQGKTRPMIGLALK